MGDPVAEPGSMGSCRVNAANFRAYADPMPEGWEPLPAETSKKVMVIGGGPGGMEAARVAAQRGHSVSLYEKNGSLGGLLPSAESIKGPHENLSALVTYLSKQQEVLGVNVVTGTEVDAELVKSESPDVVIVATGGIRGTLDLVGSGSTKVFSFSEAVGGELGENVTIVGSNCQAVDMCLYLLEQGKNVTIVTPDPAEIFEKGHSTYAREFTHTAITARGVHVWSSASLKAIGDGEITFISETGPEVTIACNAIVDMSDMLPDTSLLNELSGMNCIAVGDCNEPYNIERAILAGNLAARSI
jgi:thioredoxin reductase